MLRYWWHKRHKISSLVAIMFLLVSVATAAGDPVINSKLQEAITKVRTASTPDEHDAALQNLLKQMMGVNPKAVDTRTVSELVALLESPDYEVRKFGTIALGQLGRRSVNPDPALNRKLEEAITSARAEKSLDERVSAAEHLCDLLIGTDPMLVSDKTIADMIELLNSPDDGVRGWGAAALGVEGPRARAAVPRLLALLPAADCLQADVSSAGAIRMALERMGVKPPPFNPANCK